MDFQPITKGEIKNVINDAISQMTKSQLAFWKTITIEPEKWKELKYGKEESGFWVVAVFQDKVIWYNDIEEGFNLSPYQKHGLIEEYGAEQDELIWAITKLLSHFSNPKGIADQLSGII